MEQQTNLPQANGSGKNHEVELLRKEFDAKLKEQEHKGEIRELTFKHEQEISAYKAQINQLNEEIKNLQVQVKDYQGELSGIEEEIKVRETPLSEVMLGRILSQAGEHLLRANPNLLRIGLGMSDEEIKKIWEGSGQRQIEGKKITDNSSFSEATGDELSSLDPKHAQGIRDLTGFFKQVPVEEFKKLHTINACLQDASSGMLNKELADTILSLLVEQKTNEKKT